MKNILLALLVLTHLPLSPSFGHGMDKPGPHGGHVRMPGAYHTEIKWDEAIHGFVVYLLDENFKNPLTENSRVEGEVQRKGKATGFACEAAGIFFRCPLPEGFTLRKGDKILLKAKRGNLNQGVALYDYPFPNH